jgi:hypothetical protein
MVGGQEVQVCGLGGTSHLCMAAAGQLPSTAMHLSLYRCMVQL